ncbi:MAG: malonyl-CoA decarboxylase family protein [Alphaproteobacteria bacterium]|nr:malonyl-CoA decarboxylase family protein [Alphaproteobacteria bacterium]
MSDRASAGFLDSVLDRVGSLRTAWRDIAASARGVLSGGAPRPDLPDDDVAKLRAQMLNCLDGRGGEVGARARAAELGRTYLALNPTGRERFLRLLAEDFDTDADAVAACCGRLTRAADAVERAAAQRALRAALTAPRVTLLRQFNALPEGVKFLVDRRAELLASGSKDPAFQALADDMRELLANWFDIGFLQLQRITWDSSAALLEKLMAYEAVHEIQGWSDLKNRLDADRRCFAFFHPRMPDEPLIFVEVALVNGIAGNIHTLLDQSAPIGDPQAADTAIFYSISNCQRGLNGISFGDFLIKRVVDALASELPRLKNYATLSPIPGFRRWLAREAESGGLLLAAEAKAIQAILPEADDDNADRQLLGVLDRPDWVEDSRTAAVLREPLLRLCARYLLQARAASGRALDPVAHFHLTNGARVERLNWLGDVSVKGLQQSAGVMVNYNYRLDHIEANHEAYRSEHKVAAASAVRSLARVS